MPPTPETRVGPYEIQSAIGMGEVYRHERQVARTRRVAETSGILAASLGMRSAPYHGVPLRVALCPIPADNSSEVRCHFGVFWSVLE